MVIIGAVAVALLVPMHLLTSTISIAHEKPFLQVVMLTLSWYHVSMPQVDSGNHQWYQWS
jgi:hypothetical protein